MGLVLLWLAAINGLTFWAFDRDKQAAIAGDDRWPEKTLLMLAALGGTPAAYLARQTLRHKTRKQPFSLMLHLIAGAQAVLLLAWLTPEGRTIIMNVLASAARS